MGGVSQLLGVTIRMPFIREAAFEQSAGTQY